MNILLDLIIIAIAGITIWIAAKRGFVKTFISAVSSLLALVVVMLFTAPLANALAETSIASSVRRNTAVFLDELIQNSEASNSLTLVQDQSGELYTVLESVGIDLGEFSDWLEKSTDQTETAFRESLVEYISGPVATLVMRALAMLILYLGASLLLKIAGSLLSGVIEHLPVIREANHMLGLVLGIVLATVRVFIFCAIVSILINTSSLTGFSFFAELDPAKTYLFRLFDAIQILQFLF